MTIRLLVVLVGLAALSVIAAAPAAMALTPLAQQAGPPRGAEHFKNLK